MQYAGSQILLYLSALFFGKKVITLLSNKRQCNGQAAYVKIIIIAAVKFARKKVIFTMLQSTTKFVLVFLVIGFWNTTVAKERRPQKKEYRVPEK